MKYCIPATHFPFGAQGSKENSTDNNMWWSEEAERKWEQLTGQVLPKKTQVLLVMAYVRAIGTKLLWTEWLRVVYMSTSMNLPASFVQHRAQEVHVNGKPGVKWSGETSELFYLCFNGTTPWKMQRTLQQWKDRNFILWWNNQSFTTVTKHNILITKNAILRTQRHIYDLPFSMQCRKTHACRHKYWP